MDFTHNLVFQAEHNVTLSGHVCGLRWIGWKLLVCCVRWKQLISITAERAEPTQIITIRQKEISFWNYVFREWLTLSFQFMCMISSYYKHPRFLVGYNGMNNHTVVHQPGLGRVTNHSYWILTTVYNRADQLAALGRLNNFSNAV